jgi:hypothetical protein
MEIQAVILCDFAQVREGVLFVVAGGVTRLGVHNPRPSGLPVYLAAMFEMDPDEGSQAHELNVRVSNSSTAVECGRITGGFQVAGAMLNPGENLMVPVAVPLGSIEVTEDGPYDVHVSVDGGAPRMLTFYVVTGPPPIPPPADHDR